MGPPRSDHVARTKDYDTIIDCDVGLMKGSFCLENVGIFVNYTPSDCLDYTPNIDCGETLTDLTKEVHIPD